MDRMDFAPIQQVILQVKEQYFITNYTLIYSGDLYISDFYNQRIRKVTKSSSTISTIAGSGSTTFSGDNGLATSASLYSPIGVAVDTAGSLILSIL